MHFLGIDKEQDIWPKFTSIFVTDNCSSFFWLLSSCCLMYLLSKINDKQHRTKETTINLFYLFYGIELNIHKTCWQMSENIVFPINNNYLNTVTYHCVLVYCCNQQSLSFWSLNQSNTGYDVLGYLPNRTRILMHFPESAFSSFPTRILKSLYFEVTLKKKSQPEVIFESYQTIT